ncbi:MAG: F0F1 ATP synthase subunit gamma [Campylobacterales bacterium]|nr:F0F1 ATP synthase subunit gamma [Campylobacterales bacterium]
MASLKDIQRKIKSVKNTQKTTRAMKLVSSAKLRRTEELAKKSKVYANKLNELINEIAQKMCESESNLSDTPYFNTTEAPKVVDIVFITADKGLCGGFNSQTIKRVNKLMAKYKEEGIEVRLRAIGRKGIDYFRFNSISMLNQIAGLSSSPDFEKSSEFIQEVASDFIEGRTNRVVVVNNGYVNMITQAIRENQLLPIDPIKFGVTETCSSSDLELEPDDNDALLEVLIKRYIEFSIYYALIDSLAAEHSARMQAMDSATNNAKDMVHQLSISYNKARQEAITTELIEIISGMESMK